MKFFPTVLLGTAACGHAWGWGCEGHQIVAMIASQHLTAAARSAVYQLLREHPVDPKLSRFCKPVATDPLIDAATWADDSKRVEKTGAWHYLDIPRGVQPADLMKYCDPVGDSTGDKDRPGCLLTGLQYEFDILKDQTRPAASRAAALRYVIHFVGDLHQPLHTTTNDDQGGNCTSVVLFDDPKRGNLHGAWDYGILQHYFQQTSQTPQQLAARIDRQYQSKGRPWLHEAIDFGKWIQEGHVIAEKVTYGKLRPKVPVAPAADGPGCAVERNKTTALKIDIDAKYQAAVMPVIEKQLAKSAYRLADVLNAAF